MKSKDLPKILIYKSERGENYYFVTFGSDPPETVSCTCQGFIYRKKCKHVEDAVRRYVRTETDI
jgi:hypothetical protein